MDYEKDERGMPDKPEKQDLVYLLINYKDGRQSDCIEIGSKYFSALKATLMDKSQGESIIILNRRNTCPLLVRISEIKSISKRR